MWNPVQLAQMIYAVSCKSTDFPSGDLLVLSLVPTLASCAVMYGFLLAHLYHMLPYMYSVSLHSHLRFIAAMIYWTGFRWEDLFWDGLNLTSYVKPCVTGPDNLSSILYISGLSKWWLSSTKLCTILGWFTSVCLLIVSHYIGIFASLGLAGTLHWTVILLFYPTYYGEYLQLLWQSWGLLIECPYIYYSGLSSLESSPTIAPWWVKNLIKWKPLSKLGSQVKVAWFFM